MSIGINTKGMTIYNTS